MERNVSDRELSSKGAGTEGLWDMDTYAEGLWKWIQAEQSAVEKPWRPFCSRPDSGPVQSKFHLSRSYVCQIIRALLSGCGKGPQTLGLQQADLWWLS